MKTLEEKKEELKLLETKKKQREEEALIDAKIRELKREDNLLFKLAPGKHSIIFKKRNAMKGGVKKKWSLFR